jgi:hypothetical protein
VKIFQEIKKILYWSGKEKNKKKRVFSQFPRTISRIRRENLIKRVRKKQAQKVF